MRKSTLLTTGAGIVASLVLGGGATLALQNADRQPTAGNTGSVAPQVSLDEVRNVMNLVDADLFTLDAPTLAEAGAGFQISVPINNVNTTVSLQLHSVRAEGYRLITQVEGGVYVDVQPGPVNTFVGTVDAFPGARVAGSIESHGLELHVVMPDRTVRVIEPVAGRVPSAGPQDYVSYRAEDLATPAGVCGTDHSAVPEGVDNGGSIELGGSACGGLCIAQIAYDCDFEYFSRPQFGGQVANVEARVNLLVNAYNNLAYVPEVQIRHEITTIIVRTNVNDPYTSFDSSGLLSQFRSQWINNHGAIVRDVAQLFTGREISGSTIGQAWNFNQICTSGAYSYCQIECCGSNACAIELAAHELGHLWGGTHISDGSIMNPSIVCDSSPDFAASTRTQLISHRNAVDSVCLSAAAPPGPFNLLVPAPGATGVPANTNFDWTDSPTVESYTLAVDEDPAFGSPIFLAPSSGTLTQSQATSTVTLVPGRTYFWQVIASNGIGQNTQSASFTVIRDCNANGIDDGIELQNPANDCNENGVLDQCDLSGAFMFASVDQGPIYEDVDIEYVMTAPEATSDVTLIGRGTGDFNFADEYLDVLINGTNVGILFNPVPDVFDCPIPVQDSIVIPMAAFNAARGGNSTVTVRMEGSVGMRNICANARVQSQFSYFGVPTSVDANKNLIPDECEAGFADGDMNCDGVISVADIAGFVLALTNPAGYAAQFPNCDINLADVGNDGSISVADIGPFVNLLTGG